MTSPSPTVVLGDLIRRRRTELRLTQSDLAHATGLSVATIRRLEGGTSGNIQNSTKVAVEEALQWRTGAVDDVEAGRETDLAVLNAQAATSATSPTLTATAPGPTAEMTGTVTWPDRLRLGIELLVVLRGEERTEATVALEGTLRAWLAEQLGVDEQHVRAMLGTA